MSKTREMKYSCPYCGREFDITVYESVNTEQDPDLRDACLSGDIFRHSCPHCHTDFMVQNPEAQTEEDRREAISIINSQAHNVCSFLESYRQLTVLAQPSMTDIPVSRIFGNLQTLLKAEPGADRVRFETAGEVVIHADSSLIPLALINIIRNAIQATDEVEDGKIEVMASAPGGKPCITVTNNGPEIPESQIEQIFMPFYSTKKRGSGSGIGLALSRQIMQLHEGTLTCSSHYPYTTFTLQFS